MFKKGVFFDYLLLDEDLDELVPEELPLEEEDLVEVPLELDRDDRLPTDEEDRVEPRVVVLLVVLRLGVEFTLGREVLDDLIVFLFRLVVVLGLLVFEVDLLIVLVFRLFVVVRLFKVFTLPRLPAL